MIKGIAGFGVFILGLALLATSCKKNTDDTDLTNTDTAAKYVATANVYVSGETYDTVNNVNQAVYWKNQEPVILTHGIKNAGANAIAVQGSDIYVSGYVTDPNGKYIAVYWKNGSQVNLTNNTTSSSAGDMLIKGTDVYITGFIDSKAVYWKNGQVNYLQMPPGASVASTNGIATDGVDIYISGYALDASYRSSAVYWKSGSPAILKGAGAYGGNIVVQAGNVYVPATYQGPSVKKTDVTYWKNEIPVYLNDGSLAVNPLKIVVRGTDVYVACSSVKDNTGVIGFFKNDKFYTLTSTDSELSGITSIDNDAYVSGRALYQSRSVAAFWKNNIAVYLSTPIGKSGYASGIFITPL